MNLRILFAALVLVGFSSAPASAEGGHGSEPLPIQAWSFNGPLGTYDQASLQRGFKIYREVCASCHAMKRVYYRNLEALGYNEEQIKNIAKEYTVMDGPNDEGDMFERPALPSDHLKSPFENDNAAKFANGGALPPDLSLIVKARPGGADYIYALLTGYERAPHGEELGQGQHWNKYFPGNKLSMTPPLTEGLISYEDGSEEKVDQYARDITHFLAWASDPHMEERKKTGMKVVIFLLVFAAVMYVAKRRVWADVH